MGDSLCKLIVCCYSLESGNNSHPYKLPFKSTINLTMHFSPAGVNLLKGKGKLPRRTLFFLSRREALRDQRMSAMPSTNGP